MNHISFEGRVVVVTGAGRGLGRAYALEFGRRGASVVVNDYAGEYADHVVAEIEEAGGTGIAAYDSIETQSGAAAVVATALDHFGTVDAVVNNAGFRRNGFVERQTPESFSVVLNVHVAGAFFVTQAAWPTFKEKGYGRVVMTSSAGGMFAMGGQSNYAAAKAGVYGLAKALAFEGKLHGIAVNTVLPHATTDAVGRNDRTTPQDRERARAEEEWVAAHRANFKPGLREAMATTRPPEAVAPFVAYLASAACTLNGEAFSVGFGRYARVFVGEAPGWVTQDTHAVRVEDVAAHIDQVRDTAGYSIPENLYEDRARRPLGRRLVAVRAMQDRWAGAKLQAAADRQKGTRTMGTTEAGHPPLPMTRTRKLDPPPQFDAWRAAGPIHRITLWNGETAWALFGHEGVRAVLRDDKTFRSLPSTPGFPTINAADKATKSSALLTMLDAPEHTVLRDVVRQEFTLREIREHKAETELLVERLLDDMAVQAPPADLIAALAAPLPARFTCRLLGVPYEDADFFTECTEVRFASGSPANAVYQVEDRLGKYFGDLVADRLATPRDDMASRVAEQVRAGTITEEAAARLLHVLLIGGFDTTKQMISLGTLILLRNPDQVPLLMADHDLWPRAIEELLRYLSVVQVERRACTVDTQIAGQVIRAGEGVLVMFNAANRDPEVFGDPDRFDIRRMEAPHVAFGFGVYQCLGQHVARLLLGIAFPRLFRRFPGLAIAMPEQELVFREDGPLFSVQSLPMVWDA